MYTCVHTAGVKVFDVGVEVVLYMCDSGASFLCEHKTPKGSLHKPSTSLKKGLSQEMGVVGLLWLIIKVDRLAVVVCRTWKRQHCSTNLFLQIRCDICKNLPANGKQAPVAKYISQTLMTNM